MRSIICLFVHLRSFRAIGNRQRKNLSSSSLLYVLRQLLNLSPTHLSCNSLLRWKRKDIKKSHLQGRAGMVKAEEEKTTLFTSRNGPFLIRRFRGNYPPVSCCLILTRPAAVARPVCWGKASA